MMTALSKLAMPEAPDLTPFEAARERWQRVRAARRALVERLEDARLAQGAINSPPTEGERRSPVVDERVHRYLGGRRPDTDRIAREVRALEERAADEAPAYHAERATWETALAAERARLAAQLLPARRAAAARIGKQVKALSQEIADARAAQAGLAEGLL
jgi:hypothetical protein